MLHQRFISFRTFCEGQAIKITPDMEQFAQEGIEKLSQNVWEYGQTVHQREVDGGTYGKRNVKIVPHQKNRNSFGWADPRTGELAIFAIKGQHYSEDYVDFIGHELIHMFDPKLNNPKLASTKWGFEAYHKAGKPLGSVDTDTTNQYYNNPWEQDAFMAQTAREAIRNHKWLYDANWEEIQTSLQKIKPETPWEIAWYKDPKKWRKYLNTVYQELVRRKQQ